MHLDKGSTAPSPVQITDEIPRPQVSWSGPSFFLLLQLWGKLLGRFKCEATYDRSGQHGQRSCVAVTRRGLGLSNWSNSIQGTQRFLFPLKCHSSLK